MNLKSLSSICILTLSLAPMAIGAPTPATNSTAADTKGSGKQAAGATAAKSDAGTMDPANLGRLDALLTVCAKADQKNRSTYERYRTELIVFGEGTKYEVRAPGSGTPAYKEARAAMLEATGKTRPEKLERQCRQTIGAGAAETDE